MTDTLKLHMVLEPLHDGRSVASVLEMPSCRVEASSDAEAMSELRALVTQQLAKANVLPLEVPLPQSESTENPWIKFAGAFKGDPYFAEIAEELRRERRFGEELTDDE